MYIYISFFNKYTESNEYKFKKTDTLSGIFDFSPRFVKFKGPRLMAIGRNFF